MNHSLVFYVLVQRPQAHFLRPKNGVLSSIIPPPATRCDFTYQYRRSKHITPCQRPAAAFPSCESSPCRPGPGANTPVLFTSPTNFFRDSVDSSFSPRRDFKRHSPPSARAQVRGFCGVVSPPLMTDPRADLWVFCSFPRIVCIDPICLRHWRPWPDLLPAAASLRPEA